MDCGSYFVNIQKFNKITSRKSLLYTTKHLLCIHRSTHLPSCMSPRLSMPVEGKCT